MILDDKKISKSNFYENKKTNIYDIDVDKILIAKNELFGKKLI